MILRDLRQLPQPWGQREGLRDSLERDAYVSNLGERLTVFGAIFAWPGTSRSLELLSFDG
jgi:hypothetical protein